MKKQITMRTIAAEANVSLSTVSRVLNNSGYVADDKRAAVQTVLEKYHYESDFSPSTGGYAKPELVALAYMDKAYPLSLNPFIITNNHIINAAQKENLRIILFPARKIDSITITNIIAMVKHLHIKGLIINGSFEETTTKTLQQILEDVDFPIVYMGTACKTPHFNQVLVNNSYGTYQATEYLIKKGHKHLLFMNNNSLGYSVALDRLAGFQQAVKEFPEIKSYIHNVPEIVSKHYDINISYFAIKEILHKHPEITGVVNWSDVFLPGEQKYIYETRDTLPSNFEITGFDDIIAPLMTPPVSAVQMPYEEMAQNVIQMIMETDGNEMKASKTVTLYPSFIERS